MKNFTRCSAGMVCLIAVVLLMMGCASMGPPAEADAGALSAGTFVQQKKGLLGFRFANVLTGYKLSFTEDLLTVDDGTTIYQGPYAIDGYIITAQVTRQDREYQITEDQRSDAGAAEAPVLPQESHPEGENPTYTRKFIIHQDKKGVLFLNAPFTRYSFVKGSFYRQQ